MSKLIGMAALAVLVIVGAACGGGGSASSGNSSPSGDSSTGGNVYYYCWDSGSPRPHHLGHQVSGDHLCTKQELTASGCTDDGPTAAGNEYWSC
jgi:hypothetical protein